MDKIVDEDQVIEIIKIAYQTEDENQFTQVFENRRDGSF